MSTGVEIREREGSVKKKHIMDYQHSLDAKLSKKAFWVSITSIIIAISSLIIACATYLKIPNTIPPTTTANIKAAPESTQANVSITEKEEIILPGK